MTVKDDPLSVLSNLDALETLAVSGKLTSIVFTSTSTASWSLTPAQLTADMDALTKISGSVSLTLGDPAAPGTPLTTNPTITLQNWQASSGVVTILNEINVTTPYTLAINGEIRPSTAATFASSAIINKLAPGTLHIRDTTGNFESPSYTATGSIAGFNYNYLPQLLTLQQAGKIGSISLRDGLQTFSLTTAEAVTYTPLLPLFSTPVELSEIITAAQAGAPPSLASGFVNYTVYDSVANTLTNLPQIEALAKAGMLGRLNFTEPGPRIVTSAANIMSGADAWGTQDYNPYPVTLTDPGTPIITLASYQLNYNMRNDLLNSIAGPWALKISGLADAGTMAAVAEEHNGVLSHLSGPVTVSGYSYQIQPYIDQLAYLASLGKISAVQLIDSGTPRLTITHAQLVQDQSLFGPGGILQGSYELSITGNTASSDFYRTGESDILWQSDDGTPVIWQMNGVNVVATGVLANPGSSWHLKGTGDFYASGKSALLWQNDDGTAAIWQMNGASFTGGAVLGNPGANWHIIGTGDFNGDGYADILWQNSDGSVAIWEMNSTSFIGGAVIGNPGASWHVKAAGDFNGDGYADVLWQNDDGSVAIWEMNGTSFIGGAVIGNPGTSWRVISTGDFNGDGKSDILW